MNNISFVQEFSIPTDQDNYSAIIPAVHSKAELCDEYNKQLKFPYFGFNWDALWDLLCDFHWIPQRHIHIYHESVASLPVDDLKVFIRIITDACKDWENCQSDSQPEKVLHFYFDSGEQGYVQEICHQILLVE